MGCGIPDEELALYQAGELDRGRVRELEEHLSRCEGCRNRLAALQVLEDTFQTLPHRRPPLRALLNARRVLGGEVGGGGAQEIMTVEEVARFLRVSDEELEAVLGELPAFEIAGRVRVRREKLLEWLRQRESDFSRATIESEAARLLADVFGEE